MAQLVFVVELLTAVSQWKFLRHLTKISHGPIARRGDVQTCKMAQLAVLVAALAMFPCVQPTAFASSPLLLSRRQFPPPQRLRSYSSARSPATTRISACDAGPAADADAGEDELMAIRTPLRFIGPYPALALSFPELATPSMKERGEAGVSLDFVSDSLLTVSPSGTTPIHAHTGIGRVGEGQSERARETVWLSSSHSPITHVPLITLITTHHPKRRCWIPQPTPTPSTQPSRSSSTCCRWVMWLEALAPQAP